MSQFKVGDIIKTRFSYTPIIYRLIIIASGTSYGLMPLIDGCHTIYISCDLIDYNNILVTNMFRVD